MYETLVGSYNIAASEYWAMTPIECWHVIAAKIPPRKIGEMNGPDYDRLAERRAELEAQGVRVH